MKFPAPSTFRAARRSWLARVGVLASSAALPSSVVDALAQAESPLHALPRVALVIGNTQYTDAPLRNPANDARAMAAALQKLGFQVHLKPEARRDEMVEAIRAYGSELGKRKAVGLFYYAGHGAQLAWRNYLIPVDARIRNMSDMQSQALDMGALLKNVTLARNPMNVIILDACRDNPLGDDVRVDQKGLSQMDAPPGTLLAYATAPGNVASDGASENGLYTQHLLKEMLAPAEKIEDVFKRVRLHVRRQSRGEQIPWESTSLEEDFYFQPPRQLKKLSEQELDRIFEKELATWERIKDAKEPAPLEEYMRTFPSGVFSEVAQLRLDRVLAQLGEKKVEILSSPENPFSKGTGRVNIRFKVGDRFRYRESDLDTKKEMRTYTLRVSRIDDDEVILNDGLLSTDLLGNPRKQSDGDRQTQSQMYISEYSVGKKWTTRYKLIKPDGNEYQGEWELKVLGRDKVTVPAGTFDAFYVEGNGRGEDAGSTLFIAYWITPEVGRFIMRDYKRYSRSRVVTRNYRTELLSYTQA
jgi:hypothetical protein